MSRLSELRHQKDQITNQVKDLMAQHPGKMPTDVANRVDELLSQGESLSGAIDASHAELQAAGDAHAASGAGWRDSGGNAVKALHGADAKTGVCPFTLEMRN